MTIRSAAAHSVGMVLIVDDHRDTAEVLCRLVQHVGYPCESAADGAQALARIRSHSPEQPLLVVLDYHMPIMSGLDVLREIREDPAISQTTVVVYSAGYDAAAQDQAIALGAVTCHMDYFLKTVRFQYERAGGVPAHKPA